MSTKRKIYYHVGMGKVASTYLQYRFFPFLKNVQYLQRTHYREYPEMIESRGPQTYVLSREFDRQMEREVKWFSEYTRDVHPIIIFRRHDSWIASQYRRFLKNGISLSFTDFIDIDNDKGFWERDEVRFMNKIKILEKYFDHKPLVLFHDELKEDPKKFFDRIAQFVGASYDFDQIDLLPKHKSYNEKQLKVMLKLGKHILPKGTQYSDNKTKSTFQRYGRMAIKYPILYTARILPNRWISKGPLIEEGELKRIKKYYQDDWDELVAYARANNTV